MDIWAFVYNSVHFVNVYDFPKIERTKQVLAKLSGKKNTIIKKNIIRLDLKRVTTIFYS